MTLSAYSSPIPDNAASCSLLAEFISSNSALSLRLSLVLGKVGGVVPIWPKAKITKMRQVRVIPSNLFRNIMPPLEIPYERGAVKRFEPRPHPPCERLSSVHPSPQWGRGS